MATHRIKSSLRWLAPLAAVAGAFGLTACSGDDPSGTVAVGSGNDASWFTAVERYVDLHKDRGSTACQWISVHAPPTPHSVLVLENCDGVWTGNTEWLQPRSVASVRVR
jgi:hypothetical protein